MSKLRTKDKFFDLSDYGRPLAKVIALELKYTEFTPIHLTYVFGIVGLLAVYFMLNDYFILAGIFLILKSVIDAADGELSRVKKTPSHSGRYLDSIFDMILNFLFLATIGYITEASFILIMLAFFCFQLQGTLYNYYYVILRTKSTGADTTSKIFEQKSPKALAGESQETVDVLFKIFYVFYTVFDRLVFMLDPKAIRVKSIPNWFMVMISIYGLGFQLLIFAVLISINYQGFVIPFFIMYTALLFLFVLLRRWFVS